MVAVVVVVVVRGVGLAGHFKRWMVGVTAYPHGGFRCWRKSTKSFRPSDDGACVIKAASLGAENIFIMT